MKAPMTYGGTSSGVSGVSIGEQVGMASGDFHIPPFTTHLATLLPMVSLIADVVSTLSSPVSVSTTIHR